MRKMICRCGVVLLAAIAMVNALAAQTLRIQAGPVAQAVTDRSATIWWVGSAAGHPVFRFGEQPQQLTQSAEVSGTKEHKAHLSELAPGKTYYFRISDGSATADGQFQTEDSGFDKEAPRLRITQGPVVEFVSQQAAVIAWSTNRRASSLVRFGTDKNNLDHTSKAPWGQETHRVSLNNLKPGTQYWFVVESSQAEATGAMAKGEPAAFITTAQGEEPMRTGEKQ